MMLSILSALAQEPPPVGEGITLQPAVPDVLQLSDGTPVWFLESPTTPLVRVEVSLRQGYLDAADPVAALVAGSLVGDETVSVGVGAARVWADVEVLIGQEDTALAALRQALQSPELTRRAVRRQARSLARRRAAMVGVPGRIHNTALSQHLYPDGHPLAFRPQTRDYRTVRAADARAAWSDLQEAGASAILVIGQTEPGAILPLLEEHLVGLGGALQPSPLPPAAPTGEEVVLVDAPGGERSWVTVTFPAPGLGEPALHAAELTARVLGGDFTSRLSMLLREELGYVYDIGAVLTAWPGHGRLEITFSVGNDDLPDALSAVRTVLEGMIERPPDAAEIESSRRAIILERARQMGTLSGIGAPYGAEQTWGQPPESLAERFAAYDVLGPDDIAAAAHALLAPEDALWMITGDAAAVEPELDKAGWTPDRIRSGWSVLE